MAVRAQDHAEFGARMETYRRVLHVHCYRMMGSLHDADDMVQETFLRAWRRRDSVTDPSSLKAWLYTIATRMCLDALKRRPARRVPATHGALSIDGEAIPPAIVEPIWLEPYPDDLIQAADEGSPDEQVVTREHITLAFMVALHCLPPRQRAVLLLQEVLEWPAREVAALLETTVPAVKSALHRARVTLAEQQAAPDAPAGWPLDGATQSQLAAYVRAWEAADIPALVCLLRDDATFSMPPIPAWYRGREALGALLARTVFGGEARGRWRLLPTRANGQPAFGLYRRAASPNLYQAYGIQVITRRDGMIGDLITFIDAGLFPYFALPAMIGAAP